jgi:hypothetical protein
MIISQVTQHGAVAYKLIGLYSQIIIQSLTFITHEIAKHAHRLFYNGKNMGLKLPALPALRIETGSSHDDIH